MDIREKFVNEWKTKFSETVPPDLNLSPESLASTLVTKKQELSELREQLLRAEFVVNFIENEIEFHRHSRGPENTIYNGNVKSESRKLEAMHANNIPNKLGDDAERHEDNAFSLADGLSKIASCTKASVQIGISTAPMDLTRDSASSTGQVRSFARLRPAPKPPVNTEHGMNKTSVSEKSDLHSNESKVNKNKFVKTDSFGKPIAGPRWSFSSAHSHNGHDDHRNTSAVTKDKPAPVKPTVPPRISSCLTNPSSEQNKPNPNTEQNKSIPKYTMVKFSAGEPQLSSQHRPAPRDIETIDNSNDNVTVQQNNAPQNDMIKCVDELKEITRKTVDSDLNKQAGSLYRNTDRNIDCDLNKGTEPQENEECEDDMRRNRSYGVRKSVVEGTKYALLQWPGDQQETDTTSSSKEINSTEENDVPYVSKINVKPKRRNHSPPDYENISLDFILTKCNQSDESATSDSDENYEDVDMIKPPQMLETDIDSVCVNNKEQMKPLLETDIEYCNDDSTYDNVVSMEGVTEKTGTLRSSISSTSSWTFVPGTDDADDGSRTPTRTSSESVDQDSELYKTDTSNRDSVFVRTDEVICDRINKNDIKNEKNVQKRVRIQDNNDTAVTSLEGKTGNIYKQDKQTIDSTEDKERARQLHMRQILVKGVLESEKTYLKILEKITNIKRELQISIGKATRLCSPEEITTIFYKVEEIHKHHQNFVEKLEDEVYRTGDHKIGEIFKELIFFFPMYMEYVNNSILARKTIQKCCEESPKFKEMAMKVEISSLQSSSGIETTTLEEILFKPVQRLQRNTLVLHDLLEHTPIDHPDYRVLKSALDLCDHNLRTFSTPDQTAESKDQHHLVKSGFVIEMDGRQRKLRLLFLFNDVIVCTKHKHHVSRNKAKNLECKWFVPLSSVTVESNTKDDQSYHCKDDIDALKKKIVSLKAELRQELKQQKQESRERWSISGKVAQRSIEKLQKKIEEQEGALILSSPHLPLQLKCDDDSTHPHTILMSTDFEREEWRDAITKQQQHGYVDTTQLNIHTVQNMLNNNASKLLPQVNQIGSVLMNKDEEMLSGMLNVTIHKLTGLDTPCDTYCKLDLDSYGHFFMKARTHICENTTEPNWDEDFELDLDGSQTLRILLYKKSFAGDILIGRSALELSQSWLKSSFQEQKILMHQISLTISIRHTPASKTLKRTPSRQQGGIFGVRISAVTTREGKTVPMFVTACLKEVEKRGLQEVGIYRVSGVTSEIQRLKKIFDKNIRQGINQIAESDIHAVTGVLKLYFRELPEPLFTESQYKHFISTLDLNDTDSREKCMLQLLHELPNENYYTAVSMVEHLVKVGKYAAENKMSLSNLSTVFGPTLLHPAVKDSTLITPAMMMMREAQDVMLQSGVLSFFLELVASGKSIRRSSSV